MKTSEVLPKLPDFRSLDIPGLAAKKSNMYLLLAYISTSKVFPIGGKPLCLKETVVCDKHFQKRF